jgi:hypothetical protein
VKRLIIIALVATALAASAGATELPPGKWWRRPDVAKKLELTTQQQERLDIVFRDAANELIDIKAEVEKRQLALRTELEKTQLSRQDISAIAAKLNDARGRLFARELMMLVDMRAVLSDAQWTRLRSELEARRDRDMREDQRRDGMGPRPNGRRMEGPMNRPPMDGRRP